MDLSKLEDRYYQGHFNEILALDPTESIYIPIYRVLSLTTTGRYDKAGIALQELSDLRTHQDPVVRLSYYFASINYSLKTRDLITAQEFLNEALSFYDDIQGHTDEINRYYGIILRLYGTLNGYQGNFIDATEIFSQAITVQKKAGGHYELPRLLSNRAATLYWLGDIDNALQNGLQAYDLLQESDIAYSENLVGVTNNIGLIYFSKNQLDNAKEFFEKSLEASQVLGNAVYVSLNSHNLIRTHNLRKEYDIAETYLDNFSNLEHPFTHLMYRISKAMIYLHSTRIQEIAEGQRLIMEVIDEEVIDHQFTILAIFTAVDYLLLEFERFEDNSVLYEINNLLSRIDQIATVKAVRPALIQSYLIRSRLELIQGQLEHARNHLNYAEELASELRLDSLVNIIEGELDYIEQQYNLLGVHSDSLPISVKASNLIQLLKDIKNNQLIAKFDRLEDPIFLIMINSGGMPVFNRKFASNVNEYLISGFLTAISSFGTETFQSGSYINKLQFQGTSIMLEKQDNIIVAYAYENDSSSTSKRFENFMSFLVANKSFSNYLEQHANTQLMDPLPKEVQGVIETGISSILLGHKNKEATIAD